MNGPVAETSKVKLDETDKAIIRELQVDGRVPYSHLAPRVGLSEAATRQRVNRLIEREVVQIVGVTDPATLGLGYQAMIGISVDEDATRVAEDLSKLQEVSYVVVVAGRFDILVEVVCTDPDHLLRVVHKQIRSISGVRSSEVFSYLRLVRQSYTWGTA